MYIVEKYVEYKMNIIGVVPRKVLVKMLNTQNNLGYWCRYINGHSFREKCSTHKTVWDIGVGISMLTALGTSSEGIVVGYVLPC